VDFRLSESSEELRGEVRAFLDEVITSDLQERLYHSGVSVDDEFVARLLERGWLAPDWPEAWGGQNRSPVEMLALHEELQRVDAPIYDIATNAMIAKVVQRVGSPEVQQRILPGVLSGGLRLVLGFSEPEAGSDVAAVRTRAVQDGDEWVITGQKMFTTNAQLADYVFLLARTNPDVAKHRGLTMFLVPTDSSGVEIQAVYTLSGERTNITFYNDVRVRDELRIGDIDNGWQTLTLALQEEHSAGFGGHLARLLQLAESWAAETTNGSGQRRIEDPAIRIRLARVATELEVSTLLARRAVWMGETGMTPVAEGPMAKLFSTEALVRATEDLWLMLGPDGLRSYFEPGAPQNGQIEHLMRFSLGTRIYAGTSEVQRNIIAQRGLGLPR
jgi:alkylation response protein AidB-like acyl-CoA dehydrogenase